MGGWVRPLLLSSHRRATDLAASFQFLLQPPRAVVERRELAAVWLRFANCGGRSRISHSRDVLAVWIAHFAAIDNPTSSEKTRELLGWQPRERGLIDDLDHARYFNTLSLLGQR